MREQSSYILEVDNYEDFQRAAAVVGESFCFSFHRFFTSVGGICVSVLPSLWAYSPRILSCVNFFSVPCRYSIG